MSLDNNNNLNSNFELIFKKDTLSILKLMYEQNPKEFVSQFYKSNEKGQSFFYLLSKDNHIDNEVIDFLIDLGFDFTKDIGTDNLMDNPSYKHHWTSYRATEAIATHKTFPEFLNSIFNLKDETLLHLINVIHEKNPSFLLDLEKQQYFILHNLIQKKKYMSFSKLCELGFNMDVENLKGESLEAITSNSYDKTQYTIYTREYNKNNNQAISIENTLSWIDKKKINLRKLDKHSQEEMIKFYVENIPNYSEAEQERLIASATTIKIPNFYKRVLKALNINPKDYNPKHYALWSRLADMEDQNFFYNLIKETNFNIRNFLENTTIPEREQYVISHIADLNKKMEIDTLKKYVSTPLDSKKNKIYKIIEHLITPDFLMENHPNNNENWFNFIMNDEKTKLGLQPYLLKLSVDAEKANEFIEKTWLSKNQNGEINLLNHVDKIPFFLESKMPSIDLVNAINKHFSVEEKVKLLETIVSKIELYMKYDQKTYEHSFFSGILSNLIENHAEEINWRELFNGELDSKFKNILPTSYDDFVSIREFELLNKKLDNTKKDKPKISKI